MSPSFLVKILYYFRIRQRSAQIVTEDVHIWAKSLKSIMQNFNENDGDVNLIR